MAADESEAGWKATAPERLIVAHEGGEGGDDAATLARLIATGAATVTTAIAVPFPPATIEGDPPVEAETWEELCAELRRRGAARIERAGPLLGSLETSQRVLLDDSPARALTQLCERERPDLLVVGSTRRGRVGRILPGSTASRVLNGAPCPVAIAPHGYRDSRPEQLERLGVGFDGSPASSIALGLAVRLAIEHRSDLEVLAVARPPSGQLAATGQALDILAGHGLIDRAERTLREAAEEALAALPERAGATVRVIHGEPEKQLLEASERLDLLVVGSRGYGALRRAVLGSVSGALVKDCACPLLVAVGASDAG